MKIPPMFRYYIFVGLLVDVYLYMFMYSQSGQNGTWGQNGPPDVLEKACLAWVYFMMTSSKGNIFRVTGHLCGEFTGPGEFPAQRPVTRSFDLFFDLSLNKRLSKQS